MYKRLISLFLIVPTFVFCQQVTNCKYWFDSDYANAVTVNTTSTSISLSINASALSLGYHQLNFQVFDGKENWSSIVTSGFLYVNTNSTPQLTNYRYWFDDDFVNVKTINATNNYLTINFDGSLLSNGQHVINFQAKDINGKWSAIVTSNLNRALATYSQIAQKAIQPIGIQKIVADPIQLGTGTYTYEHKDLSIPVVNGTLNFTRYYNTFNSQNVSMLGYGWSHSYNYFLENQQDTTWNMHYPDGHVEVFTPTNINGQSTPFLSGTLDSLQKNANSTFSLYTRNKTQYHFDVTGKLDSIIDLNANNTLLYYTGNNLDSIVGQGGRSLKFSYTANNISAITDPLNRSCTYAYDGNNNLVSITDFKNNTSYFTYDNLHRMLTDVNNLGNIVVDNSYDVNGKVVTQKDAYSKVTSIVYESPNVGDALVTNPDNSQIVAHHDSLIRKTLDKDELGFTKMYAYDIYSNETGFTNENNISETRQYDNYGNLTIDTLPGKKIAQFSYNNFNSPLQITDARGNTKTFYYNSINNNLDSIHNPDNSIQSFKYNSSGQMIQSKDGNGNIVTYTYSAFGDVLTIQTFTGIKQYSYDASGRKNAVTDERGNITKYEYDNNDNIIKVTDALGRRIESNYDAANQLLSVKDKNGNITSFTYDKKGRKISSTNAAGAITTYAYDVRDNLISVTDANNNTLTYSYDAKGRKISSTNALGTTIYQYDAVGNLIKTIDPTNKTLDFTYSATNKKTSQKDGLNNTITYAYDNNNNLVSIIDPLNRVTAYSYDVANRLITVTDAANKTTAVTYDKNGNKIKVIDANTHEQTYSYDAANRIIGFKDAAGNNFNYTYDSVGNNTTLIKPTGTITRLFDAANRVITVNNSTGNNYHFIYDNNDNVLSMSNVTGTSSFTYNNLNQLIQYHDPFNKTVSYTYDAVGNKKTIVYPGGYTVNYGYDATNNLKSVTDWLNHTFIYSYDAAGRTTQVQYPNTINCKYNFDAAGRLTSKLNFSSNNTIIAGSSFTLDAIGNKITEQRQGPVAAGLINQSRAYIYGNDDRMLTDSIWNFANDNSGNRTAETNGVKTATYTFSVDNILNSRVDTSGIASQYSYDVNGHRLSKSVGVNSSLYVLDKSSNLAQILQITDASGVIKSNYIYGLGLLETIDAASAPLYYHFDAQHNTSVLTDQTGILKDSYTYDPFGTLLSHSGTTIQPFTFLGEYGVEQETPAIYYVRARYYDATNGRFISKDLHDYDLNNPQTINKYVYSTNNPISNFDFNGYYSWTDYASNIKDLNDNFENIKNSSETLPWLKGFNESVHGELSYTGFDPNIKLDFGKILETVDYTKKLNSFYFEESSITNDYLNNNINGKQLFTKTITAGAKVLPHFSSLIQLNEESKKLVNDYMDNNIDNTELWTGIFISGTNVIIPGYKNLADYLKVQAYNSAFGGEVEITPKRVACK